MEKRTEDQNRTFSDQIKYNSDVMSYKEVITLAEGRQTWKLLHRQE